MFWLKKESVSIRTWIKSAIYVIGGPAGLVNKTSSTATSNVYEVKVVLASDSFAVRSS